LICTCSSDGHQEAAGLCTEASLEDREPRCSGFRPILIQVYRPFVFGGTRPVHPDDGGGMLAERSIFLKLYAVTSEETLIVTFGIPFSRPSISPRRRTPFPGTAAGYREKPREEQLVSALEQQPAPMTSDPK